MDITGRPLPFYPSLRSILNFMYRKRKCSVGIATGYGLGGRDIGVRFPEGAEQSRVALGPTQPLSIGYRALFLPGVEQSGRETDHSPPQC
jgi:hypothetical protein